MVLRSYLIFGSVPGLFFALNKVCQPDFGQASFFLQNFSNIEYFRIIVDTSEHLIPANYQKPI